MSGSIVTKTAGSAGSVTHTLNQTPIAPPEMRFYSDFARATLVHGPVTGVATANPNAFTYAYPAAVATGVRYVTVTFDLGSGELVDADDAIVFQSPVGALSDQPSGPCAAWATADDVCNGDDLDADVLSRMLAVASDWLWAVSGHLFSGQCSRTIRPCSVHGDSGLYWSGWDVWSWSRWSSSSRRWNGACGCNHTPGYRHCSSCFRLSEIRLSDHPVTTVSEVKVDGVVLDPSLYRVDDGRWLVRLENADGTREGWPCCQDLVLADTEEDTWSVTYTSGLNPPTTGVLAAATLAAELTRACTASGACRLPAAATSVVRQGVSIDLNSIFTDRRTGLLEVDMFLMAHPSPKFGFGGVLDPSSLVRHRVTG